MLNIKDTCISGLIRIICYSVIFFIGYILLDLLIKGFPIFSWDFFTTFPRDSGAEGGIFPVILGSFYLIIASMLFTLPIGIGTAIYLVEFAKQNRFTRMLEICIITLAGIPSIVFGLFGLGLFVIFLNFGSSILAGSLTLSCMALPLIITASVESLKNVPIALKDASLALGATHWTTIRKIVLPYAIPGMSTGSILAVGRVAGETAPILFTAAAFFLPGLPDSIFSQIMALPYHLYILSTQHPEIEKVRPYQYGTALTLILLVFTFNSIAIYIRYQVRKKYHSQKI